MQRNLRVGAVQRLAATVRLAVDRVTRADEGSDVGDCVMHTVAVAAAFDMQRLIQIHRLGRVDGDQRDLAPVQRRHPRRGGSLACGDLHLVRKHQRQLQLALDVAHALRQQVGFRRSVADGLDAEAARTRHGQCPGGVGRGSAVQPPGGLRAGSKYTGAARPQSGGTSAATAQGVETAA